MASYNYGAECALRAGMIEYLTAHDETQNWSTYSTADLLENVECMEAVITDEVAEAWRTCHTDDELPPLVD